MPKTKLTAEQLINEFNKQNIQIHSICDVYPLSVEKDYLRRNLGRVILNMNVVGLSFENLEKIMPFLRKYNGSLGVHSQSHCLTISIEVEEEVIIK